MLMYLDRSFLLCVLQGWVSNGVATVLDTKAGGHFQPQPDNQQGGSDSITVIAAYESGGSTVFQYSRALDTGDSFDTAIVAGPMNIVWAHNPNDGTGTTFNQHAQTSASTVSVLSKRQQHSAGLSLLSTINDYFRN